MQELKLHGPLHNFDCHSKHQKKELDLTMTVLTGQTRFKYGQKDAGGKHMEKVCYFS